MTEPERKINRRATWKSNDEIVGLDVPMFPPAWIPKGYVQDFVESEMRWKVRPEGRRHYLPYFPVINFENPDEPIDILL